MTSIPLTVHMMVKNEDQWVRYSLLAILPYVSRILITDTGSTDHTLDAIQQLSSPKIKLTQTPTHNSHDVSRVRMEQLQNTKTDWFLVVDGDEIYPKTTISEVINAINTSQYEGVTVRRYDLLGDIYHRQSESVGSYEMWGQHGHLVLRALNKKLIPGLQVRGDYPLEGYYDGHGEPVTNHDKRKHYITHNYLYHSMYLRRSSLGSNLTMLNRSKYKIESGLLITTPIPEVFQNNPPLTWEKDPRQPRSSVYELASTLLTPIKKFKRALQ